MRVLLARAAAPDEQTRSLLVALDVIIQAAAGFFHVGSRLIQSQGQPSQNRRWTAATTRC